MSRRKKSKYTEPTTQGLALTPLNARQAEYIKALQQDTQVVVLGPAGTGKTFIAATMAADLYLRGEIEKIVITRPNVPSGRSLGFFPGTLEEKMAPWAAPITDVIRKHLGEGTWETGVKNGRIEVAPFETMRGRSFSDAFVILDEAQNTLPGEMKMFLTRIGERCRVVINGDIQQSDLREASGLAKTIHLAKKHSLPVPVIEFSLDDIVRSEACAMWIRAWIKEGL